MKLRSLAALATMTCVVGATFALPAHAADPKKDAGAHFDRGVSLSSEADYSAALVEFRRAYELAPNPVVLYNIGQTYFQLRNYAAALTYLERYLAESGPNPSHGAEVEQSITTLQSRVGKVTIDSNVVGEVFVDDELQGKTPQTGLRISVGRHRVAVKPAVAPAQERTVEISAGDTVPLGFTFATNTAPSTTPAVLAPPVEDRPAHRGLRPVATGLWIGTGVLAAGAVVTGIVAVTTSSSLSDERNNPAATRDRLDSLHSRMRGLSITTDVLTGAAVVAGGMALYFTLSKPKSSTQTAFGFSPRGLSLRLTY